MPKLPIGRKRPWVPERKAQGRRTEETKFYQSSAWRRLRNAFIKDNPLCVECHAKGIVSPANVVDHIVPIRKGGAELNIKNLQSLCSPCHNRKSGREAHQ
ncbi:HNH endonuclease [Xanthovirga aplysinae]|uniref:HNH endonuclease n=1 Tax=Xanthovirga aplysinae TaxID=2529853 RepID=UPI0012BD6418|nr:HNH endonuclease signature motif containing protein [Xanthovirga aplysinae]MTI32806.1 HNH endonuclease [Xanthovirga aplysinae]